MDESRTLEQHLFSLESRLLDSALRRDPSAVASLLSDDFVEFGSSGRTYTKASVVAELSNEAPAQRGISSFKLYRLAEGVALVTYVALSGGGPGGAPREALRSSIWKREGTEWKMAFHQGTMIEE